MLEQRPIVYSNGSFERGSNKQAAASRLIFRVGGSIERTWSEYGIIVRMEDPFIAG
jgi:hypothetical protein